MGMDRLILDFSFTAVAYSLVMGTRGAWAATPQLKKDAVKVK